MPHRAAAAPALRPPLDRDRILAAALAQIDREGVDGLNLRGLASELGVYPTAIYWHVPNRNELVAGAVALALRGVGERLASGPWQQRLRTLLKRFRAAVQAHPNIAPVIGTELISNSPFDLPMLDHLVALLEDAGFGGAALVDAFNVVIAAMCGFVTLELARAPALDAEGWAEAHRARLAAIPKAPYPALARHLARLGDRAFILRWTPGTHQPLNSAFEAWLDVIVAGLEARAGRRR